MDPSLNRNQRNYNLQAPRNTTTQLNPKSHLHQQMLINTSKYQAQEANLMAEALAEDPTIFDYDSFLPDDKQKEKTKPQPIYLNKSS